MAVAVGSLLSRSNSLPLSCSLSCEEAILVLVTQLSDSLKGRDTHGATSSVPCSFCLASSGQLSGALSRLGPAHVPPLSPISLFASKCGSGGRSPSVIVAVTVHRDATRNFAERTDLITCASRSSTTNRQNYDGYRGVELPVAQTVE